MTDLRAAHGELRDGVGPIGQSVVTGNYSAIQLLSDHNTKDDAAYLKWLATRTKSQIRVHNSQLTGPTEFGEIFEAAASVIRDVKRDLGDKVRFTYHLSPGTPAMAAVWILLSKTIQPAELIESSLEKGVRSVALPFDISAEYLPDIARGQSETITRITQGLPPEAPEFDEIVHRCKAMKHVIAQARRLAAFDVPVLIQGESGTGKELLARAIHASSAEVRSLCTC